MWSRRLPVAPGCGDALPGWLHHLLAAQTRCRHWGAGRCHRAGNVTCHPAVPRVPRKGEQPGEAAGVHREDCAEHSRAAVGRPGRGVMPRMEGAGCTLPGLGASCQHCRLPRGCISRGASPAGRRREVPCAHPGWAGWAPPRPPLCSGGAAEPLRCWRGSGCDRAPPAAELGLLGAQCGRGGLCLCVCVCTHPAPKGPCCPCLAPTSLLGATCSCFSSKC